MMVHLQLYWILQNYKDNFKMIKKIIAIIMLIACSLAFSGCDLHKDIVHTAKMKDDDIWTITQYGPREMNLTFYTIHNPTKGLIVIDGGWQEDAPYVREIINSFGGHVDAWILTHPHVDHIGAFLDYMAVNSENVETVYYSPFTREFFEEEEDPAIYEIINNPNAILFYEFLECMENTKEQVEYIPMLTGDILEIGDLQLECFASFTPDRHDVNANSLVFTISYDDFVLLLTGDMTELTLEDMKEELPKDAVCWDTDIIQIPHHGYMAGIGSDALYQATKPKYALLDCTVEEFENNSVNIQEHIKMIENLDIEVLKRYDTEDGNKIYIYVEEEK